MEGTHSRLLNCAVIALVYRQFLCSNTMQNVGWYDEGKALMASFDDVIEILMTFVCDGAGWCALMRQSMQSKL